MIYLFGFFFLSVFPHALCTILERQIIGYFLYGMFLFHDDLGMGNWFFIVVAGTSFRDWTGLSPNSWSIEKEATCHVRFLSLAF
jgi:hypothetical protein